MDIQAVDGETVEVRVERSSRVTEAAAKEILPRLQMVEDVTPEKVLVSGERLGAS